MNPSLACPMESLPKLPPLWSGPSSPPQCRKDIFFVLGDNRPVSEDSRYVDVGMVDVRNVLGKAEFRLFPFDRIGLVE